MIISHKYKYVFIRTQKTASTSIEKYLRGYLGPDDIATEDRVDGWPALNCDPSIQPHASYRQVISEFGGSIRPYYSFAFDRNPWDRAVSEFHFKLKAKRPNGEFIHGHELTLNGFRESVINRGHLLYYPNHFLYLDASGDPIVDQVFKYEDINKAFHAVCIKLGVPWRKDELLNLKSHTRPSDSADYRKYYDPDTEEIIRKINEPAIKLLDYKF